MGRRGRGERREGQVAPLFTLSLRLASAVSAASAANSLSVAVVVVLVAVGAAARVDPADPGCAVRAPFALPDGDA